MAHLSQPLTRTSFTISKTNKQKDNFSSLWIDFFQQGKCSDSRLALCPRLCSCTRVLQSRVLGNWHSIVFISLFHTQLYPACLWRPPNSHLVLIRGSVSPHKPRWDFSFLFFSSFSFVGPLLGQSLCRDPTCGVTPPHPPQDYLEEEVFKVCVPPNNFPLLHISGWRMWPWKKYK